jgi:phosphoribosylformylglycinamidine synthase
LSKVPVREANMTAYEIMLSESQERMLLVCKPERFEEIRAVFEKWDLSAAIIGSVTDSGRIQIMSPTGERVVDMPVAPLAEQAPMYDRPYAEPDNYQTYRAFDCTPFANVNQGEEQAVFERLLTCPNIASKEWVYRQYDSTVRTNTVLGPDKGEAALLRIKGTDKAFAVTTDCNPRLVHLDPHLGTVHAVAEAARNISCTGATPLAITDCMNFGSPETTQVMWQFKRAVDGMSEACLALNTPVVSGNVSFYNETNGRAVLPTPAIGMVGLLKDRRRHATNTFAEAGMAVVLLGDTTDELGGSEYLQWIHGHLNGAVPALDLDLERRLQSFVRESIARGWVRHARDCSLGGLAIALAKCCFGDIPMGADIELGERAGTAAQLFGESPSRIVVALAESDLPALADRAAAMDIACTRLGTTGGEKLVIRLAGREVIRGSAAAFKQTWHDALWHTLED